MGFNRRSWYLLAALVPLVTWLLATSLLADRWDVIREATVIPVGEGIEATGQSVAVFTDLRQPERLIACEAIGPKKKTTPFTPAPVDVQVDSDGRRWQLLGLLDTGHANMKIVCTPADGHTDSATYAHALLPPFSDRATSASAIAWGGIAFGLLLAGVVGANRYRKLINRE